MMDGRAIDSVLSHWGLEGAVELSGAACGGSPGRVISRTALTCGGADYVLESLPIEKAASRIRQAECLEGLAKRGLGRMNPWLRTREMLFGAYQEGTFWQLRKYAHGELELPDGYADDSWRGEALAEFLSELHGKSADIGGGIFLLSEYISRMMAVFGGRNKGLCKDLSPAVHELEPFLEAERDLPMAFCHGDYHPQNVIWGERCINAVIDWEFCGTKTAMYDVANLLGCVGMDCPENYSRPLVASLLRRLHESGCFHSESWRWLPECVAASRIAWLREWCFMDSTELMVQELDFIWLLLDNRELLRRKFAFQ